jgi:hypothetical protein
MVTCGGRPQAQSEDRRRGSTHSFFLPPSPGQDPPAAVAGPRGWASARAEEEKKYVHEGPNLPTPGRGPRSALAGPSEGVRVKKTSFSEREDNSRAATVAVHGRQRGVSGHPGGS